MNPFTVELYDKAFQRTGFAGDALSVAMTVRHNRRSQATLTVRADHLRAGALLDPGARAVLTYQPDGTDPTVLSGRVHSAKAAGPGVGAVELTVLGDWDVLGALTWPVPGNAVGSQTSEFYTASGAAETVIKQMVTANVVTRLGRPVTVAASAGRGSTVSVKTRFEPLGDVVTALAEAGGIGVTVRQVGAGFTVDCYEPVDRTNLTLSEANHTIADWSWTSTAPEVTRVVAGGAGEGTARTLRARTDSSAETAWGMVREAFVDASQAATNGEIDAAGDAAITEAAATSGFAVTLVESAALRYGRNIHVGDRITVEPLPGYPVTDILREVTITWTASEGAQVEPVFGDPDQSDPQRVQAAAIARLATAVRRLRAR